MFGQKLLQGQWIQRLELIRLIFLRQGFHIGLVLFRRFKYNLTNYDEEKNDSVPPWYDFIEIFGKIASFGVSNFELVLRKVRMNCSKPIGQLCNSIIFTSKRTRFKQLGQNCKVCRWVSGTAVGASSPKNWVWSTPKASPNWVRWLAESRRVPFQCGLRQIASKNQNRIKTWPLHVWLKK